MATISIIAADGSTSPLDVEEYVRGVLPYEMSTGWPLEALQAQAVAARSYAVKKAAPLYTDTRDQVYGTARYDDTDAAVAATAGQVLAHLGHPIMAFFFGNCDGRTRSTVEAGWTGAQDPECFQSVPCECGYTTLFGHGIGMCQRGAAAMARRGVGYREILAHYYQAVELVDAGTMQPVPGSAGGAAVAAAAGAGASVPPPQWYTVQSGDTLGVIARRFGTTVAAIQAANAELIKDVNVIEVSWKLRIAGAAAATPDATYTVLPGDTLASLAMRWGVPVSGIIEANPQLVPPGTVLRRPG
ncbi:MAG: SpoIID/LytB domain-containing protein [Chloroflexi bacterium]|nr:SpoIID/LytB domain-containing protein [Chloroflexota bacterium]